MEFEFSSNDCIDKYFTDKKRMKVANAFSHLFKKSNMLINKSEKDLWKLGVDENGDLVVERLFEGE